MRDLPDWYWMHNATAGSFVFLSTSFDVNMCVCDRVCCVDDSDDDREVSRKRTVRQAASKAVSKQREILLGDGGSEDEEHEDPEESYMDRTYTYPVQHCRTKSLTSVYMWTWKDYYQL